jgi:hypothetical protein
MGTMITARTAATSKTMMETMRMYRQRMLRLSPADEFLNLLADSARTTAFSSMSSSLSVFFSADWMLLCMTVRTPSTLDCTLASLSMALRSLNSSHSALSIAPALDCSPPWPADSDASPSFSSVCLFSSGRRGRRGET